MTGLISEMSTIKLAFVFVYFVWAVLQTPFGYIGVGNLSSLDAVVCDKLTPPPIGT